MGTANQSEVKYVAGFLFNDERSSVALIHKTHGPACMVGKWNAIGGKRKRGEPGLPDESSYAAMWREFQEEAGVAVKGWTPFLKLKGPGWSVDFFHAFSSLDLMQVHTCEGEKVDVFHVDALPETVPNLNWIIPMALGHEDDHVWVYEVTEKETFAPRAEATKSKRPALADLMAEVEKRKWAIVPPTQETRDWTVYRRDDAEFGFDDELGYGLTMIEAVTNAISTADSTVSQHSEIRSES
jgi:8-oxo-dGTP pyrophosphatase MutT (NUDIX family)